MKEKEGDKSKPGKKKKEEKKRVEQAIQTALTGAKDQTKSERTKQYQKNIHISEDTIKILEELLQEYDQKHGDKVVDDPKINQQLIQAIDTVIKNGEWEGAMVFEVAGKKIKDLREELIQSLDLGEKKEELTGKITETEISKEGMVEVYVSVYLTSIDSPAKWEYTLSSIKSTCAGRPVYKNEEDARKFIDSRKEKGTDAYVAIYINEADILRPKGRDVYAQDKFGSELLLIRQNAFSSENISKFVHRTGVYKYHGGKLELEE